MKRPTLPRNKIATALDCARLSRDAYPEKRVDNSILNGSHYISDKKTDTQCYVVERDKKLYVVFRGTELKFKDMITDLMVMKTEVPFDASETLRAFKGFLRGYISVRESIHDLVTYYSSTINGLKIIPTGHSLGGVLSRWCALDLSYNDSKVSCSGINLEHYDYGAPPMGNGALADSFNKWVKKSYIMRDRFDGVPLVPLSGKHHKKHIRLDGKFGHNIDSYIHNLEKLYKFQK